MAMALEDMKIKEKLLNILTLIDEKCVGQFGFHIKDATFMKIVDYMFVPKDSSSLAVTRILFGLAMLFDIPDERGGATMDKRWGDAKLCHFPLLPFVQPLPMPYMALVYAALWIGACGIMLGYKYRASSIMFTACYWYLFLIEKSYWNNHSYLFGLVGLLLACTQANCYWSIDAYIDPKQFKETVPYWNYFILKYQFFILYFMAGMKKGTSEWLTGYSVQNLSDHWVFTPFKLFLTTSQTDYLVVHWYVFVFDLTVAMWMMCSKTRNVAMLFCALFHLMNSRLFRIGMFPWVCLATMPLFYPFDWPKRVIRFIINSYKSVKRTICWYIRLIIAKNTCTCQIRKKENIGNSDDEDLNSTDDQIKTQDIGNNKIIDEEVINETPNEIEESINTDEKDIQEGDNNVKIISDTDYVKDDPDKQQKHKTVICLVIFFYVVCQLFLPYSHFITKGYNNWTNGLYGYSWDMMVHSWDIHSVVVKVVDNDNQKDYYVDPYIYTPNYRWTRHGDMVYQYAQCLKETVTNSQEQKTWNNPRKMISNNISVYVDVWCSMNGRFAQRIFDPKVDLIKASWSPFTSISYLMPLLDEALDWRGDLEEIKKSVHSWNNYSDVIFYADFPGYDQEKYIPLEITNVTLTVLDGSVVYEPQVTELQIGHSYQLAAGDNVTVDTGILHKVLNIGEKPAYYMYTYLNSSEPVTKKEELKPMLPIRKELLGRFNGMALFASLVFKSIFQLFFSFSKCQ